MRSMSPARARKRRVCIRAASGRRPAVGADFGPITRFPSNGGGARAGGALASFDEQIGEAVMAAGGRAVLGWAAAFAGVWAGAPPTLQLNAQTFEQAQ